MRSGSLAATCVLSMGLLVVLAGCATPGPRERSEMRLEHVMAAAGEPVDSFRFWNMQRWESLGSDALMVWTRPNEAWLLRVDAGCWGLEFAQAIALTSNLNRVTRRFDSVTFEDQRCRIEEIRPVDTGELSRVPG